jgi:hypothetical protein
MGMNLHGKGKSYQPEVQVHEENGPWELRPQKVLEGESVGKYGIM